MSNEELEIKNKLPNGWAETILDKLGEVVSGGTPSTKDSENFGGYISWVTPADLTDYKNKYISKGKRNITRKGLKGSSAKLMPKGSILFSSRAPIGYTAIASNRICTNQGFKSLIPCKEYLDSEYIYYYLKNSKYVAESFASGTTFKEISGTSFKKLPIKLPPLNEQKRIVSKIEKLFSNLDNSDKYLIHLEKQLKRYRQSVLKSAFKNDNIENWKPLEDIFEIERGGSPRPIKSFLTDDENGINWIKIGDVAKGQKYIESTKEKIKPEGLKKSRLVVEGDFILSNSMSFGRPYIMKTTGAIHDGWLLLREKEIKIFKDYFFYLLSSSYMYEIFKNRASGSTVKNLKIDAVKPIKVPCPKVDEQKEIVKQIEKHFSIIDKLEATVQKSIKESKRLRQSILKQAFEGKLVEQDENDESASVLLEKIAKAKEEYKKSLKEQNKRKK